MSDARLRATLTGAVAILLWATLALGATLSAGLPPFELLALTFSIGGLAGLAVVERGGLLARLRQPPAAFALGVAGLFGYHFFYFVALAHAPPVDASLINYLWPLLIVLFSGLLPGERLQRHHLGGGLLGLAGAWVLISGGGTAPRLEYLPGYVSVGLSNPTSFSSIHHVDLSVTFTASGFSRGSQNHTTTSGGSAFRTSPSSCKRSHQPMHL